MIKVNYNINGKILGFYPDAVLYDSIPEPFIEIDEKTYDEIFSQVEKYKVVDGKLKDISEDDDYKFEQNLYNKNLEVQSYRLKIKEIEASQHRAIREYIVNPSQETVQRLIDIDSEINEFRSKIKSVKL